MKKPRLSEDTTQTEDQAVGIASSLEVAMTAVDQLIERSQDYLLKKQNKEGYWVGELEADVTVTAGYIPFMYFMTGNIEPERQQKVVNYIISKQRVDGSWGTYYDGPGDLNVTIQAYFALKLTGISPAEPFMRLAREFVLSHGGITKANVFTKIWLALFGQFDWRGAPSIPPEIILLPNWFYFNIYEFASWSRATIVALMVVLTKKPVCHIPQFAQVSELYVEPEGSRGHSLGKFEKIFSWRSFLLLLDRIFKTWEKLPLKPGHQSALRRTERWIIEHQEADGSWGGIMLPWIYSLIALKSLGRSLDYPAIAKGLQGLEGFIIENNSTLRLQPATSPVWDTAWAVLALRESGLPADHPALVKAAHWLLKEEIQTGGDWQVKNPKIEPGCWAFEFENDLYPDIDDTAVVPRALLKVRLTGRDEERKAEAIKKGVRWVVGMQGGNGGWAAFDRDNNKKILSHISFADFMTPLDPTSPDVTAHVIELLGELNTDSSSLRRAISYIKREQGTQGSWYGRWGVNYIYGTGLVLASLQAAGEDMTANYVRRAVSWLRSCQDRDGGWSETCHTYKDPLYRSVSSSTASQTAWALLGLISAGKHTSSVVKRGVNYLIKTQQEDGSWQEAAYTGTGFPKAFYLRYDLYRIYFPLLALARYRTSTIRRTE